MNRRDMLVSVAGGLSAAMLGPAGRLLGSTSAERTPLGVCVYCLGIRSRAERARGTPTDFTDPLSFLEYCRQLGAGGIQVPLGTKDEAYTAKLRRRAEDHGMFIEGILGLPRDRADVERFEAEVRTAKRAGANVIRVVIIPGRRYERFDSADEFRKLAEQGLRLFERISSEYVGACVDTGNSFTLLEDPMEVVEAYAPWAFSVHLKDQAVGEYDDGFLFADVPLGEGFLDLGKMVETLRTANPQVRFSLEMITRDPLEVPCLTEKYWATLADVRARDLARTLRVVRTHACGRLPQISSLPLDEQARREEENVKKCLAYAGHHLGL